MKRHRNGRDLSKRVAAKPLPLPSLVSAGISPARWHA